ncbi:MAG: 50S ribosomal protein L11 methyltransferase [Hyphomicrobiaceae bacterium]|nr:50S ribosomal protein L11 methyltransferase [Hyphomicrobiaceae bacterium]
MYKLTIVVENKTSAYYFFELLSEMCQSEANAISIFEYKTIWTVDAYYGEWSQAEKAALWLCSISIYKLSSWVVEQIADQDWVVLSQTALPPVYAGRFTIHGSHDRTKIGRGQNRILIDAGEAFGTAHHPTTHGCLIAIDLLTRKQNFKNIMDIGTGSGVLALALRRTMPRANILATDLDARATKVAKNNALLNNSLSLFNGRLFFAIAQGLQDKAVRLAQPFNLIVANILAVTLTRMVCDIRLALRVRGSLILSGILIAQSNSVIACYKSHGFSLCKHIQIDGWSTLIMVRR